MNTKVVTNDDLYNISVFTFFMNICMPRRRKIIGYRRRRFSIGTHL